MVSPLPSALPYSTCHMAIRVGLCECFIITYHSHQAQGSVRHRLRLTFCLFISGCIELRREPAYSGLLVNIYVNEYIEVNPSPHPLLKRHQFIKAMQNVTEGLLWVIFFLKDQGLRQRLQQLRKLENSRRLSAER